MLVAEHLLGLLMIETLVHQLLQIEGLGFYSSILVPYGLMQEYLVVDVDVLHLVHGFQLSICGQNLFIRS